MMKMVETMHEYTVKPTETIQCILLEGKIMKNKDDKNTIVKLRSIAILFLQNVTSKLQNL